MDSERADNEYALGLLDDLLQENGGGILLQIYNELGPAALSDEAVAKLADHLRGRLAMLNR